MKSECDCIKILIVDDNNFNIYSLQMILQFNFGLLSDSVSFLLLIALKVFHGKSGVEKVE